MQDNNLTNIENAIEYYKVYSGSTIYIKLDNVTMEHMQVKKVKTETFDVCHHPLFCEKRKTFTHTTLPKQIRARQRAEKKVADLEKNLLKLKDALEKFVNIGGKPYSKTEKTIKETEDKLDVAKEEEKKIPEIKGSEKATSFHCCVKPSHLVYLSTKFNSICTNVLQSEGVGFKLQMEILSQELSNAHVVDNLKGKEKVPGNEQVGVIDFGGGAAAPGPSSRRGSGRGAGGGGGLPAPDRGKIVLDLDGDLILNRGSSSRPTN